MKEGAMCFILFYHVHSLGQEGDNYQWFLRTYTYFRAGLRNSFQSYLPCTAHFKNQRTLIMSRSHDIHSELEKHIVPLPTGVSLEVDLIKSNSFTDQIHKLAICLHPWSWLGGQKDDPYVHIYRRP